MASMLFKHKTGLNNRNIYWFNKHQVQLNNNKNVGIDVYVKLSFLWPWPVKLNYDGRNGTRNLHWIIIFLLTSVECCFIPCLTRHISLSPLSRRTNER